VLAFNVESFAFMISEHERTLALDELFFDVFKLISKAKLFLSIQVCIKEFVFKLDLFYSF
jgi:hypothetical protein